MSAYDPKRTSAIHLSGGAQSARTGALVLGHLWNQHIVYVRPVHGEQNGIGGLRGLGRRTSPPDILSVLGSGGGFMCEGRFQVVMDPLRLIAERRALRAVAALLPSPTKKALDCRLRNHLDDLNDLHHSRAFSNLGPDNRFGEHWARCAAAKETKMMFASPVRRRTMLAAAVASLLTMPTIAQAAWPDRPIRLIVPFAPGASNDILARTIAMKLSERLGQPIVVENKGGAGGVVGTEYVAKSAPDGNTLLFVSISITTNAAIRKTLPYDVVKDLQPIGEVGAGPFVVVVSNALNVKTLQEFIDLARAKPNSINYGSAGVGGINHLGTELFAAAAKVQLVHVPYKGMGPAFNDLIAGNLQMGLPSLSSVAQHIHAGTMRGLAVTGKHRSPLAPELPTADEAGLPGFELEVWWGLVGPANMPPAVVKRLNDELNAVLEMPEMQEALKVEGATTHPSTPEEFGNLIRADLKRWKEVVANAHIEETE